MDDGDRDSVEGVDDVAGGHRRRPRYSGTHPRRFDQKYKELDPSVDPDTVARVLASGRTPAGMHRPIMVREIIGVLQPAPGCLVVDATLGWGGHSGAIIPMIVPGGHLFGLDCDPVELPKAESRLRLAGWGPDSFSAHRINFSGISRILDDAGVDAVDCVLADLGLSSMQIDDPSRGFSVKQDGPLDMRMNPSRGITARALLEKIRPERLASILAENSDEPEAEAIAAAVAGRSFSGTAELARTVRQASGHREREQQELAVRRVFQAIRIEVNEEFSALDSFLRALPACLKPGGRVAILTFHSGEDRRVKKSFKAGLLDGTWSRIADEVVRASPAEQRDNPRSAPAKLRWAVRS
ncbi:MAG TPA: 16S rRNA (cytosine(1402)-N(4))-methyltransferase RsmH [Myxococcota bacterium]|nr:16S rRNA (cytosine(1402)-N(4))-methyltransferase RsmH [Myxococcota bacterium]HPV03690.1 16S rRNA (cytosine(1402)-N(4))-methyltransferase RsmH [Myxococcota bacterium]